jgi:hypothetical protein
MITLIPYYCYYIIIFLNGNYYFALFCTLCMFIPFHSLVLTLQLALGLLSWYTNELNWIIIIQTVSGAQPAIYPMGSVG